MYSNQKSKLEKYMKLFKKKAYRYLGHASRNFQYEISSDKEIDVIICSGCGKPITGKIFYCPRCSKYYGLECVVRAMGGFTCPQCDDVTFLKTVKVVHADQLNCFDVIPCLAWVDQYKKVINLQKVLNSQDVNHLLGWQLRLQNILLSSQYCINQRYAFSVVQILYSYGQIPKGWETCIN